ncbi:hypothetical protein Avbf_00061 [Armadillidium vulgare]|nr:hypothetical protein Avbf_00061 [Armadillidium vulgare]
MLHGRAERGPNPNSRPSSASQGGQRDATWLSLLRLHVLSYSRVPPRILSREFVVSSVKAFCGQKGALCLSFCHSPTLAPEATSLRNLLSGSLSAGGCCTDVQRGAPNSELSDQALRARRTAGRNLALSTASPPHRGASFRGFSVDFVVSSVKACVDRRVPSSQLLPPPTPRSEATSYEILSGSLSAGGCCMDVQERAPNSELSTKLCKAGGQRDATLAVLLLRLHVLSSSRVLGNRSQGKSCPNR